MYENNINNFKALNLSKLVLLKYFLFDLSFNNINIYSLDLYKFV